MKNFPVDDELVALIWKLANPQPFENLSFNEALRRVIAGMQPKAEPNRKKMPLYSADELLAELDLKELGNIKNFKVTPRKRAQSPKAVNWLSTVSELRSVPNLKSWQDICTHLGIEVGGDSARRKLQEWVQQNKHPKWPAVPDV